MAPKAQKVATPATTTAAAPVAAATPAPAAAKTPAPAAATTSTSTKKDKVAAAPAKVEEVKVAAAPAATETKKATKAASTKTEAPAATPAPAAAVVAAPAAEATTDASDEENKGERRKPTKDTINAEFDKLKKWFEDKICVLCPPKEEGDAAATDANGKKKRKRANKGLGIKDVRFLKKTIEQIQKDHIKVAKIKNNNRKNLTSGLKKEVLLSDELYDFCGFAKGSLHSRVEVNTQLNKYVKDRNLQDTKDGRLIHPDAKLKALLRLEAGYAGPIKFWELTQKTACHFINTNATATKA